MTEDLRDWEIVISSQREYDSLVAEIFFRKKFVALINQDGGVDSPILETPGANLSEKYVVRKFPLHEFISAIQEAEKKLKGQD